MSAFNDIVVSPIIVGWHSGYFHWNVAASVWMPAGDYDKTRLVNTGRNYWSVVPQFSATYFDPKAGWDVSASSMYIVSYENTATHYNSGDVIQIDLAAGKMISPQFKLGVVGYYLQQVTPDSGIGNIVGDRKLRVAGAGPAATFSFLGRQRADECRGQVLSRIFRAKHHARRLWHVVDPRRVLITSTS